MSLKVLCVYIGHNPGVRQPLKSALEIPHGFALIATLLKNCGCDVDLLVLSPEDVLNGAFRRMITTYDQSLTCFSCVSSHFSLVRRIAQTFKSFNPGTYVVVGGSHATLNPGDTITFPEVDAVCVGEGEHGIGALAAQLNAGLIPAELPNFWLKNPVTGEIAKNQPEHFTSNLDGLPFIDRELWKPWIENPGWEPAVLIGRGCPNNCSFCCNHKFKKLAKGRYVRFRSTANIIEEIAQLVRIYDTDLVYLETETISANLKFASELCNALKEFNKNRSRPVRFRINFSLTDRIAQDPLLLDKLLDELVAANVRYINIGLESGSEALRRKFRRPLYSNRQFIDFCHRARQHNLSVRTYVMIGLPGETLDQWKETIAVVKKAAPDDVALSIFFPYPGTEAHEMVANANLLKVDISEYVQERQKAVLESSGFPVRRVLLEFRLFERKVLYPQGPWKTRWHHKILAWLIAIPPLGYLMVSADDVLNQLLPGLRSMISQWLSHSYPGRS